MANNLYDKALESFVEGQINWLADTIHAYLIDAAAYTADLEDDEFLSSIPAPARIGSPVVLTGKTSDRGAVGASPISFSGLIGAPTIEAIVLVQFTGDPATSRLIARIDTGTGLPLPSGQTSVNVAWGSPLFKLGRLPEPVVTVPGAPTSVSASAGNAQASVSFAPPASNGGAAITAYRVTASTGQTATGASSPITVAGLTNGTPVTFTVAALNSAGYSPESSPSASVTPATVPGAPTIGTATAGNGTVSVSFSAPGSNGGSPVTGYEVLLSNGNTATGASSPISVTTPNGSAVTATVRAQNAKGYGAYSSASNSVTPSAPATAPGAPTSVTATAGDAQASVAFTAPASNGGAPITGYRVTASTGATATGSASPIVVPGLTNGTAVTFTVAAQNSVGYGPESAASNSVTPTTNVGYDIILAAGQSNMNGRAQPIDAGIDVIDPMVFQFGSLASDSASYRLITPASDPMKMPDTANANRVGPSTSFGRAYAARTGRKVLLVPVAIGGTAIVGGRWSASAPGDLYTLAITQANLAITAAKAQYADSQFVGTIWFQGETDGDNSVTQANYAAALNAVIAGFRAGITDASNSWFVMAQMVPEAISTKAGYSAIDLAHKQIAAGTPHTAIALTNDLTGFSSDNLHFTNSVGIRQVGARLDAQVPTAIAFPGVIPSNTAVPVITGTAQEGQTLSGTTGTWTGSPTSYTRQWRRNGSAISGATASTYLLQAADVGTVITFAVTATNAAGTSPSPAVSAATATVIAGSGGGTDIVYTFEADTVGAAPANTTPSAGYTFLVATGGSSGLPGNYARMADSPLVNTAAAGMTFTQFDSRANQVVKWKHGQGTTGTTIRAGMVLRAGALPSGGTYPLMATGYLFMFRGTEMRIYRHAADGTLTQLAASSTFTATLNRDLRATISGTALTFEHSVDGGANWTVGCSATDASISAAGGVQFVSGFGGSQGGAYIDDVTYI